MAKAKMINTKEEMVEIIESGQKLYATSYAQEKEIANELNVDRKKIHYYGHYYGESFVYNGDGIEIYTDDMIYVIERG